MTARLVPAVVSFDLDGTLLGAVSVSLHLAARLGGLVRTQPIEAAYRRGEITVDAFAQETAQLFRGVSVRDVWTALARIPTIRGLDETLAELRAHNVRLLLASCTWRFASEYFGLRYGFDAICGTEMARSANGRLTGTVVRCVDGSAKATFVAAYCAGVGVPLDACVAIGNSSSDIPMFEIVGRSIALNATPEAREAAAISVEADDLREILPLLLSEAPGSSIPVLRFTGSRPGSPIEGLRRGCQVAATAGFPPHPRRGGQG